MYIILTVGLTLYMHHGSLIYPIPADAMLPLALTIIPGQMSRLPVKLHFPAQVLQIPGIRSLHHIPYVLTLTSLCHCKIPHLARVSPTSGNPPRMVPIPGPILAPPYLRLLPYKLTLSGIDAW